MYKNHVFVLSLLAALASVHAAPLVTRSKNNDNSDFVKQNGLDARTQNQQFASMKQTDSCQEGSDACIDGGFAQCIGGKWMVQPCSGDLKCFALPLVNKPGTSLSCDTEADATARIAAAVGEPSAGASTVSASAPSSTLSATTSSNSSSGNDDESGHDCGEETEGTDGLNTTDDGNPEDDCEEDSGNANDPTTTDNDPASSSVSSLPGSASSPLSSSAAFAVPSTSISSVTQPPPAPTASASQHRRQAMTLVPVPNSASLDGDLSVTPFASTSVISSSVSSLASSTPIISSIPSTDLGNPSFGTSITIASASNTLISLSPVTPSGTGTSPVSQSSPLATATPSPSASSGAFTVTITSTVTPVAGGNCVPTSSASISIGTSTVPVPTTTSSASISSETSFVPVASSSASITPGTSTGNSAIIVNGLSSVTLSATPTSSTSLDIFGFSFPASPATSAPGSTGTQTSSSNGGFLDFNPVVTAPPTPTPSGSLDGSIQEQLTATLNN